ncbi:beta-lactamase class A [Bosea sp. OAE506]|uniref:class A beta-lactamase n=1 Tax=Bosea sp. OAE506 TaxID=2663870 RepID=UPI001789E4E1
MTLTKVNLWAPDRRSLLLAGGFSVLAAGRNLAAAADALDLRALETRIRCRLGVFATFQDRRVGWRSTERFAFCSTFKLFLAAYVMQSVQEGRDRLDRPVVITAADMVPHGPVTQPAVGRTLTIEELCKATVDISDNPAANILIREMGGLAAFGRWYRSIGDEVTRVDRMETDLNSALPGDLRDTTTAEQYVANLDRVLRGNLLTPAHLSLLNRWITQTPTGQGRIKAGVPAGYTVGHKTGTGARKTHNDIGIMWAPQGASALISVFCTGAVEASPETVDAAIANATRQAVAALGFGRD